MFAPSPAVRPFAGAVARCAATAPSDASERASGKKRPRVGVAPARDSSACLTKISRNRNSVVTAAGMEVLTVGGEMSSQELLQKRLASELDALRGLLKKAELISQRGACKGGTPTAGKKDRFLACNRRPKPIEEDFNAPSVKRRKISTLVEQKQKQVRTPRMSPEERNQLAGRLSSLSGELPGHIVEFLQKHFGDADSHGEIEINIDSVEDSVLFELKTLLDKLAEESKDDKLAEEKESKGEVVLEQQEEEYIDICGLSPIIETGNVPRSSSSGDSNSDSDSSSESDSDQMMGLSAQQPSEPASGTAQSTVQAESVSGESTGGPAPLTVAASEVAQSAEAKKVQAVQRAAPKAVYMPGLIYRANLRRQLLEMERAALPDESIHPRDLQRLGIAEYGCPSVMRQIGLVLKADA